MSQTQHLMQPVQECASKPETCIKSGSWQLFVWTEFILNATTRCQRDRPCVPSVSYYFQDASARIYLETLICWQYTRPLLHPVILLPGFRHRNSRQIAPFKLDLWRQDSKWAAQTVIIFGLMSMLLIPKLWLWYASVVVEHKVPVKSARI